MVRAEVWIENSGEAVFYRGVDYVQVTSGGALIVKLNSGQMELFMPDRWMTIIVNEETDAEEDD